MKKTFGSHSTTVWVILTLATILSFALAEKGAAHVAATVAILIGAFKARCIIVYFMEVPWNPKPFRIIFEIWVVMASLLILGGYWYQALRPA